MEYGQLFAQMKSPLWKPIFLLAIIGFAAKHLEIFNNRK